MEPKSFVEQFKGALDNSVNGSAPQPGLMKTKALGELILENTGSVPAANRIMEKILPKLKSIGTVDVAALRVVSLADRVAVQRNAETRFLDWLEARGPAKQLTDYQYRIIERFIGTQYSGPFNVDASSLPANVQSSYGQRYNTLTAIGDTLKPSFMAQNITNMQDVAGENLFEAQMDDEIVRIRKGMNRMLLSNTEVVSESPASVPQLGGMITRSTNAPIAMGGSNFTNALLQQGVDQIAALYGYDQLALFVTKGQMAVIRDLMINRFPGENSATHLELMRSLNPNLGLPTNVVYMPYPGVVIPVYYDLDMPANTQLLLKADLPRLARMKFDGSNGPLALARPESTLFDLVLVFDLFTLDDPLVSSRVVYQNSAS